MKLGYNTNGFAHHRLEDALEILAELGYQSIALTLDWHTLYPGMANEQTRCEVVRRLADRLGLSLVIETGARFLLDPRRKHQPTLLDSDPERRQQRRQFLKGAIELASTLEAQLVSIWSGTAISLEPEEALWPRLVAECRELAEHAERHHVRLAFEPEPGMFIATVADFSRLRQLLPHPALGLTLDVGHVYCQGEGDLAEIIYAWREWLWNVHLEDMLPGRHEHLAFGEGTLPVRQVLEALHHVGYSGGVHVELSRHSHDAVTTARESRDYLLAHGWLAK
jgi:sugar phosphate isomerase/epimerase